MSIAQIKLVGTIPFDSQPPSSYFKLYGVRAGKDIWYMFSLMANQIPKWCFGTYYNNLFKSYFGIAYIFFMIIVGWEHTDIGFQNKRNDIIKARNGKNVLNIWELRTKGEGQGTFRLIAYKRGRFIRILRHYILKQVFPIANVKTSHDNDNPFLITMKY